MPVTGITRSPQQQPNQAQWTGTPESHFNYALVAAAPVPLGLLMRGGTNQGFTLRGIAPETPVVPATVRSRLNIARLAVAGHIVTVTQAQETDLAQPVKWAPKIRIARQAQEVDLARPITRTGTVGIPVVGLYESLLSDDRPLAWWGLDTATPTHDDSGSSYTLSSVGAPANASTLLLHGDGLTSGARDFNGTTDAMTTAGTVYVPPTEPPNFHAATAAAGNTIDTVIVSPGDVEAGDLMLVCLTHGTQTATIASAPPGWTQVGTTLNATTCAVVVYSRSPVADEPPTEFRWTWSVAGTTLATMLVYRDCDQSVSGLVFDSGRQVTASGAFHSTTTQTNPVQSHALAFWCNDTAGATISPDPTGLTKRIDISTTNLKIVAAEYDLAAAGSVTKTATTSQNTTLGAVLLTFGAANKVLSNSLDTLSQKASIHALIQPDTISGLDTIVRKQNAWGLHLNGGVVEFVYRDSLGVDQTVVGPSVSSGITTHLVVADDGLVIHFWKNGVHTMATRLGAVGYTTNTNQVTLGAYYTGTYANFFDGRLDEVAVFNAPLTNQMVQTYYTASQTGVFGTYLQPSTTLYPRAKLEIAWRSNPTDDVLVYEDVTADLRASEQLSPQRGRNFELDRVETGRMDFTLSNRSRQYDDTYALSPYYPYVTPTRAVRLRAQAQTDGPLFHIFFGYTEGHPLLRIAYGKDSVAHFTAADPFKALALDKVAGTLVRAQELTGARLQALLDGEPGVPYSGEAGKSLVVGDDLNGSNVLDHAQNVVETEGGIVFADSKGTVVFQDRHHRTLFERTARATYGDGGGAELPIKHIEPQTDEARLFTAAAVTPSSGNVQRANNILQSLGHFIRTKEMTTLHALDADAKAMANAIAARYGVPRTRIPRVVVQPANGSSPLAMWATVLGHELSHRIKTVERPIGDTTPVIREHFIEGVTHRITGDDWQVEFSVSPAELEGSYSIIGTSAIGGTDVIGW